MPFCSRCGRSADTEDVYCKFCGAPIEGNEPFSPHSPPPQRAAPQKVSRAQPDRDELTPAPAGLLSSSSLKVLGIAAIIVVIAIAVFLALSGHLLPGGTVSNSSPSRDTGTGQAGNPCPANLTRCSGSCVDLQTDPANCGGCGFAVPYGETCVRGAFSESSGKNTSGSSRTATATPSPATTGTTPAVSAAATATAAAIQTSCTSGLTLCSGSCRNLKTDSRNCGSCGYICPSGTSCQNSWCLDAAKGSNGNDSGILSADTECTGGETLCGSTCVNLLTDENNCAVCGRACGTGDICVSGRCGPACSTSGTTLCGTDCVDLETNMSNCGSCGTECETFLSHATGSTCTKGKCVVSACDANYGDCDGSVDNGCEANLRSDVNNCGSCGTKCPTGELCYSKVCKAPATTTTS